MQEVNKKDRRYTTGQQGQMLWKRVRRGIDGLQESNKDRQYARGQQGQMLYKRATRIDGMEEGNKYGWMHNTKRWTRFSLASLHSEESKQSKLVLHHSQSSLENWYKKKGQRNYDIHCSTEFDFLKTKLATQIIDFYFFICMAVGTL